VADPLRTQAKSLVMKAVRTKQGHARIIAGGNFVYVPSLLPTDVLKSICKSLATYGFTLLRPDSECFLK
jgi:hypothetical protein